jgi:siroheme synthase (precorrin-2 oxidase/ferrochelatase)
MQRPRDARTRRIREIIEAVEAQVVISREIREHTHNLIQTNAELRELRRENLLTFRAKREHWEDT